MINNSVVRLKSIGSLGLILLGLLFGSKGYSVNGQSLLSEDDCSACFALYDGKVISHIIIDSNDYEGVEIAAQNLKSDLVSVTSVEPSVFYELNEKQKSVIIIGTIGHSYFIDELIKNGKIDVTEIKGRWESSITQVVNEPFKGVDQALVIAGSDKRGTIFGIYNLSEQIGVSPWYWWADVPVIKKNEIYIKPEKVVLGEPAVKYRGIFINDEAPALSGWSSEKFGGFNHQFYEKVFELILRLKGNYLWPAMWGSAFYDDDSLNARLADDYGVVIGTSHHEPLMRAHDEWRRYGSGPWNYTKNAEKLNQFWTEGIQRMGNNESLVTIGMRGDGDEPMSEGTAITLLEGIVKNQREIIETVTGKPADQTPQVWALYKEVQDYYDQGMRVPDDVTLLLCDDNWGNLRILPNTEERIRKGGFGIYYHYDFVGGPRNYKWINTNQIERVWEQMNLANEYGASQLWLVNVGDIKPMEFPISFFLDFAWNPDEWTAERLPDYYTSWATEQFGELYATEIGEFLALYSKYNSRRKPEMLAPETYSLTNYREAERIVAEYNLLTNKADSIYQLLPTEYKNAYYQLVLFPIKASANMNEMYVATAKNRLYKEQQRASTNYYASRVEELFNKDALLTREHHTFNNGKWNHMMSQTHIGYTNWQQPEKNSMPKVETIDISKKPQMGITVEGTTAWWPQSKNSMLLPQFDPMNDQEYFIEIYNQGVDSFNFSITPDANWVKLSEKTGYVSTDKKIWISINWEAVPKGYNIVLLTVSGSDKKSAIVQCEVNNPEFTSETKPYGFIENNGVVAVEAENFTKSVSGIGISWQVIPNLGRTGSAVTTIPVTSSRQAITDSTPHLEYPIFVFDTGSIQLTTYLSPTLNFMKKEGLCYAISLDDEQPQIVNMHLNDTTPDWQYPEWWNVAVSNNCIMESTKHQIKTPGNHVIKYWMVDPGIDLQRIVLEFPWATKYSYLGPEESRFVK